MNVNLINKPITRNELDKMIKQNKDIRYVNTSKIKNIKYFTLILLCDIFAI